VKNPEDLKVDTLAIRGAQLPTDEMSHSEALFMTSSFAYDSAEQAAARFSHQEPGNIYSRFINPTVGVFEKRLAQMEGGQRCVAFASGMAAISSTFFALLSPGDHVVSSRSIFGTTDVLYNKYLKKFGVDSTQVDIADLDAWRAAIRPETRLLFLETPSNPLSQIGDIRALAALAHEKGALLVVDNCFCTPVLQQPFALGADIVIHSATKFIDGQGRSLGGAVIGREKEMEEVHAFLRTNGACLSPFNAWLFIKGLETLTLRMNALSAASLELARWLEKQPGIACVHYAGLESHPQHALAASQQSAFGAVIGIEVVDTNGKDDQEVAWRFMNATEWLSITANLGDTKSTLTHPASTTHGRVAPDVRAAAGIRDNLVRLAVGLENVADIKTEMTRGLVALGHKVAT
jgi:O-succinylhomoserine sulfhydrylase